MVTNNSVLLEKIIFPFATALCLLSCGKEFKPDVKPAQKIDIFIDYSSGQTEQISDTATYTVINWNNSSGNGYMYEFKNYCNLPPSSLSLLLYFTKDELKINSYNFTGGGTLPGMAHLSYMTHPTGYIAQGRPVIDYTQLSITKMYKARLTLYDALDYIDGTFKAKMAKGNDSIIIRGSFQGALLQSVK